MYRSRFFKVGYNVLHIPEGGDYEAQDYQFNTNV